MQVALKKNIYIHIGYPKTASSLLQEEVFPKMDGVSYLPEINTKKFTENERDKEEIYTLIKNISSQKILISSENISFPSIWLQDYNYQKSRAIGIKSTFPNAKIIIVIRDHKDFILSQYAHAVKRGAIWRDFNSFLSKFFPYIKSCLQFHTLIETYQNLFGAENVLVLSYENFKNDPADFFKILGDFMDTPIDINAINTDKKVNVSSRNKKYIQAMCTMNFIVCVFFCPFEKAGMVKNAHIIKRRLARQYGSLIQKIIKSGDPLSFSKEQNDLIESAFSESIKMTNKLLNKEKK